MKDKRPRGRPPLDPADPSVSVHVRLVGKQYDAYCTRARLTRRSVAATIRAALVAQLRPTK